MKTKLPFLLPLLAIFLTGCFDMPFVKPSIDEESSENKSSLVVSSSEQDSSSAGKTSSESSSEESSEEKTSSVSSEKSSEESSVKSSEATSTSSSASSSEDSSSNYSSSSSSHTSSSEESSEESSEYSSSEYSSELESSEESSESQSELESSEESSEQQYTGTRQIQIYATNDIHGTVEPDSGQMGIGQLATYLKNKKAQGNTLLLDQGDTWQGSVYSNFNHGKLITDVMNYVHFDARTVGNHDFDWGASYIAANKERSYQGYSTPFLAGNVYDFDWPTNTTGTIQQSSLGGKSVVYTVDDVKIGILGGIGKDQITSITSSYTETITFTDHIEFIKNEATHLRNDLGCDLVICSIHTGQESVMGNQLNKYVDLVLCGHTHSEESANEGSLYYVQGDAYTKSLSHVTLTYDFDLGKVTDTDIEFVSSYGVASEVSSIDTTVQKIITDYEDECNEEANEVLASNVTGQFKMKEGAPHVMTRAIMDYAAKKGYNVDVACVNQARSYLPYSEWTYADIYTAFPFDNAIYIAEVTGQEFMNEIAAYSYICRSNSFTTTTINLNATYKVAIIDYLYCHIDMNNKGERYYDYFPTTGGSSTTTLDKNYREILREWLRDNHYNTGTLMSSSNYSSTSSSHAKNFTSY